MAKWRKLKLKPANTSTPRLGQFLAQTNWFWRWGSSGSFFFFCFLYGAIFALWGPVLLFQMLLLLCIPAALII